MLEHCSNGSLYEYLKKHKTIDVGAARYFIANIVNGLEYLHKKKIIHRDLKPANILINHQFELKLADFGTARIIDWKDKTIINALEERDKIEQNFSANLETRKQSFVGTNEYMSPEVINSDAPTPMTDIWGLGILLYEMLTGYTPFKAATEWLTYGKISEGNLNFKQDFPSDAEDLIRKCLKKTPNERIGYDSENDYIRYDGIKNHSFFNGIDFN